MKSSFFKYIFIIFVIGIIGYSIYLICYKDKEVQEETVETEVQTAEQKKDLRLRNIKF